MTPACIISAPPPLPFAHLNLRFNPFGEPIDGDRGNLAVVAVEPIEFEKMVERLASPGFAIQFLGEKGRGKTTHLRALHSHFPSAPYLYFDENARSPTPSDIPDVPLLFLDEAQRISPAVRKKIFRRNASWVIGTHADHSREFSRTRIDFSVYELKGLSVSRLLRMIDTRIGWAVRDPNQKTPRVTEATARELIRMFGDDVRAIEGYLYETFQTQTEMKDV